MRKFKIENLKFKIKRGDKVKVVLGKDRGKEGTVEKVDHKTGRVLISGVNVYKRHVSGKRLGGSSEGGIIDILKSVNISNVLLVCPNCHKPTRVGMKIIGKEKARVCKKCRKEIGSEQVKK